LSRFAVPISTTLTSKAAQPNCVVGFVPEKDFAGRQLLGSREEQQDAYAFCPVEVDGDDIRKLLIVVADGVGGHLGGREAAQTAVRAFIDGYFFALDDLAAERGHEGESNEDLAQRIDAKALYCALDYANERIADAIDADRKLMDGAGTTLLAVLANETEFRWISVGDSPLFLFRKDRIERLNADHSLRSEPKVDQSAGEIQSPNTITSALAGSLIPLIDGPSASIQWQANDLLIAASDGLLTLESKQIEKALKKSGGEAVQKASEIASTVKTFKKVRQDNTTVAVLLVPRMSVSAPRPTALLG
jgi:serine/threonine protein phosphatase PrpC